MNVVLKRLKTKKMIHHSLAISHLNIEGLHDTRAGFKKNIEIYLCSETWACDHDISVLGFKKIILKPNKATCKWEIVWWYNCFIK